MVVYHDTRTVDSRRQGQNNYGSRNNKKNDFEPTGSKAGVVRSRSAPALRKPRLWTLNLLVHEKETISSGSFLVEKRRQKLIKEALKDAVVSHAVTADKVNNTWSQFEYFCPKTEIPVLPTYESKKRKKEKKNEPKKRTSTHAPNFMRQTIINARSRPQSARSRPQSSDSYKGRETGSRPGSPLYRPGSPLYSRSNSPSKYNGQLLSPLSTSVSDGRLSGKRIRGLFGKEPLSPTSITSRTSSIQQVEKIQSGGRQLFMRSVSDRGLQRSSLGAKRNIMKSKTQAILRPTEVFSDMMDTDNILHKRLNTEDKGHCLVIGEKPTKKAVQIRKSIDVQSFSMLEGRKCDYCSDVKLKHKTKPPIATVERKLWNFEAQENFYKNAAIYSKPESEMMNVPSNCERYMFNEFKSQHLTAATEVKELLFNCPHRKEYAIKDEEEEMEDEDDDSSSDDSTDGNAIISDSESLTHGRLDTIEATGVRAATRAMFSCDLMNKFDKKTGKKQQDHIHVSRSEIQKQRTQVLQNVRVPYLDQNGLAQMLHHYGVMTKFPTCDAIFNALAEDKERCSFSQIFKLTDAINNPKQWVERDIVRNVLYAVLVHNPSGKEHPFNMDFEISKLEKNIWALFCPKLQQARRSSEDKIQKIGAIAETLYCMAFTGHVGGTWDHFADHRPEMFRLFVRLLFPLHDQGHDLITKHINLGAKAGYQSELQIRINGMIMREQLLIKKKIIQEFVMPLRNFVKKKKEEMIEREILRKKVFLAARENDKNQAVVEHVQEKLFKSIAAAKFVKPTGQ